MDTAHKRIETTRRRTWDCANPRGSSPLLGRIIAIGLASRRGNPVSRAWLILYSRRASVNPEIGFAAFLGTGRGFRHPSQHHHHHHHHTTHRRRSQSQSAGQSRPSVQEGNRNRVVHTYVSKMPGRDCNKVRGSSFVAGRTRSGQGTTSRLKQLVAATAPDSGVVVTPMLLG